MIASWQDAAALGAVALAAGYLARLSYRALATRRASGGGCSSGCGSCPSGPGAAEADGRGGPLVSIGPPRRDDGPGNPG